MPELCLATRSSSPSALGSAAASSLRARASKNWRGRLEGPVAVTQQHRAAGCQVEVPIAVEVSGREDDLPRSMRHDRNERERAIAVAESRQHQRWIGREPELDAQSQVDLAIPVEIAASSRSLENN